MPRPSSRVALLVAALGPALGCGPTRERIESWRAEDGGQARLEAAVQGGKLTPALRGQALAALLVSGHDLGAQALARIPPPERPRVAGAAVTALLAAGSAPVVRDGLFVLRQHLSEAERGLSDRPLLGALAQDLHAATPAPCRLDLAAQVKALGAPAVQQLVAALGEPLPDYVRPTEILVALGDADALLRGSEALLRRAQSPPAVHHTMWKALALLPSPAAEAFLEERIQKGPAAEADEAARALARRTSASTAAAALRSVGSPHLDDEGKVRLAAVAAQRGGASSVKELAALLGRPELTTIRGAAVEAVVASGGPAALAPLLEALPAPRTPREREALVAAVASGLGRAMAAGARRGEEASLRAALEQALRSRSPLAQAVASRTLAVRPGRAAP